MRCVRVNIRNAAFILLTFLVNNINQIQMADNHVDSSVAKVSKKNNTVNEVIYVHNEDSDPFLNCPINIDCNKLNVSCMNCTLDSSCRYGEIVSTTCNTTVHCKGSSTFQKSYICRYCYQTETWEHKCDLKANCNSVSSPRTEYITNCTVNDDIICLGHRTFNKKLKCNWTGGYRWSTALALSITLGGFGADRFYLGHWQEGIGKLFSFGGLGVWTLIDVILISLHYLGPADGSLYI